MKIHQDDERVGYGDAVLDNIPKSAKLSWSHYLEIIKTDDENKTIGILLSTDKNETIVKYTLSEDNKTIFSSEYKLQMPTEQELIYAIEEEKKNFELNIKS